MSEPVVFGTHDETTLKQLRDVASRAEKAALMADGHVGYVMPIGGVAAYEGKVSAVGVGFDIACGNCAIRTDLSFDHLLGGQDRKAALEGVAIEIQSTLSFGIGRTNRARDAPTNHPLFNSNAWESLPRKEREPLLAKARSQLGTIGSGNHYVDVFADEDDRIWVGVHFGSRGLGYTIASGFMALGQGQPWGARVPEREVLFDLSKPLGQDYWALMELSGEYAYAGREWVARKVVELLGGLEVEMIHNHHNFAWRERHAGRDLIVVRKGATPAFPGQKGFVGGSMGDDAVILEGFSGNTDLQKGALYSTVHGAGRVMSRTEARGKVHRKSGKVLKPGRVTWEMLSDWLSKRQVVLKGGGLDEAPQAYRRLDQVLAAQGETITLLHRLRPLVVVMAGADEFDPYRD